MKLSDKLRDFSLFYRTGCLVQGDWLEIIGEAERLESQNQRLRELVREAYTEGFNDCPVYGDVDEDIAWLKSSVKAALAAEQE